MSVAAFAILLSIFAVSSTFAAESKFFPLFENCSEYDNLVDFYDWMRCILGGSSSSYGQGGSSPYGVGGQSPYGVGGQSPYGVGGQTPYGVGGQSPYGQGGQSPYGQGGSYGEGGSSPYGQGGQSLYGQGGQSPYGQGGSASYGEGGGAPAYYPRSTQPPILGIMQTSMNPAFESSTELNLENV